MLVKSVSTRRAALSFVAILAVLVTSAEHAMASSSENASSRRMLRQANANERKLGFWSWTNLLALPHPPGPHPNGSDNSSSGSTSSSSTTSDNDTGDNNRTDPSAWGSVKCWVGMKEACQISNQADEEGGDVNGNSAPAGATNWGVIGMAVGATVLVAAIAGFLLKKRSEQDEDSRQTALLTKPGEDLESVDGTLATGAPTVASGSTGAKSIEMAKRTNADEEAGSYINMDKLTEDKGLVPELDYTESEGESDLMGTNYVEISDGRPVAGEGGPMWAAAATAAATAGAAVNPVPTDEAEEISQASSQTSETQESIEVSEAGDASTASSF